MPYKDPEAKKAYDRARYLTDPKKIQDARDRWRAANPERHQTNVRKANRKRAGMKDATGEQRTGVCPVCGNDRALHCDHDHSTGFVRDFICGNCNRALGLVRDRPEVLDALAAYLRKHATK